MSEEEKHDLKKSKDAVGCLYPVLLDKSGKVIDSRWTRSGRPSFSSMLTAS